MRGSQRAISSIPAIIIVATMAMCSAALVISMINYKKAAELKLRYEQTLALLKMNASEIESSIHTLKIGQKECEVKISLDNKSTVVVIRRGEYKIIHGVALYCPEGEDRLHIARPRE